VKIIALAIFLAASGTILALAIPIRTTLPDTVHLEELTWVEVDEALRRGVRTVIVPTGGIEQNGPHMVLGKHNYIVHYAAERIARNLGDALVAPVVTYVPEGSVDPPSGHMSFAGTISVPDTVFANILEFTARSLRAHGFETICFIGDSGGNQEMQEQVARRLNAEWRGDDIRVIHIGNYYAANGQVDWLLTQEETNVSIGDHAGIRDTSELLVVFPAGIRSDMVARRGGRFLRPTGVSGDPTRASAERGKKLLSLKIEAALRQIRAEIGGK
jgi:creatinine amidohydrolase